MSHKFYDIKNADMIKLFNDAKDKSYEVKIDKLDCSKSFSRESASISYEEILDMYEYKSCHTVFIHRVMPFTPEYGNRDYIETGFSTMSKRIDYFLFINLDISYLEYFIEKYKLKEM